MTRKEALAIAANIRALHDQYYLSAEDRKTVARTAGYVAAACVPMVKTLNRPTFMYMAIGRYRE